MTATRALGVDLGGRRIGLAISDPTRTVATPLVVITRGKDQASDHARIVALAKDEGAGTIVVGLPLSLSGRDGPAAKATRAEVEALRAVAERADMNVVLHDERLTTVSAERSLNEAGVKRADQRDVVDKVAATIMLQAWLDGTRA